MFHSQGGECIVSIAATVGGVVTAETGAGAVAAAIGAVGVMQSCT
jgi:hypothetical protein